MQQYLLSIYQPDGDPPPAEVLEPIMAEGKEHIGGFTVIQAADLDSALEWGRKLARVLTIPIEVRPMADEADRCDPPVG